MAPPAPPSVPVETTVKQDEHNPYRTIRNLLEAARSIGHRKAAR